MRLFWNELVKKAALQATAVPDYDQAPLSYIIKKIMKDSVGKW